MLSSMTAKQIKVEILLSVNLGDYYNESVNHRKDLFFFLFFLFVVNFVIH